MVGRHLPAVVLAALLCGGCSQGGEAASTTTIDPKDPVVYVTAHQWSFSPDTITLQEGGPVTLDFVSEDVHHGFNLPDFDLRVDVLPDMHAQVRLVPNKKGTFTFLCDYYCGGGHENMNGTLSVQ